MLYFDKWLQNGKQTTIPNDTFQPGMAFQVSITFKGLTREQEEQLEQMIERKVCLQGLLDLGSGETVCML